MSRPSGTARTPHLARLLAALGQRLRWLILCQGVGTVLGLCSVWLAFAYVADFGLRVPLLVRVGHGVVLLALFVGLVWRALLRPLRRVPDEEGLALLFERAHPELHQLLVSAVQFQRSASVDGDPELVDSVLAEADRRAQALSAAHILEVRAPRRRLALGLTGALVVVLFGLRQPDHMRILFDRMLGGSMGWPQATHLSIELPGVDERGTLSEEDGVLVARIARGTDVPIVVRAEGVIPDDVRLAFGDRADLSLARSGGDAFRTLLRSVQEPIRFHAEGGDDLDGTPAVRIEVLQPPDVTGIAFAVSPPPYSGLPEEVLFDPEIDVLAGSTVRVHVQPSPSGASGSARLVPDDERVALEPLPFPTDPLATDPAEPSMGLGFERRIDQSLGFRIELLDESGLSNPDPALFRVTALEDRAPEVSVLAPARSDFETVLGGAIPLRARAQDDLALAGMDWRVEPGVGGEGAGVIRSGSFELQSLEAAGGPPGSLALGSVLLEVDELGSEEAPPAVDQRFVLRVRARDNRAPTPNEQEALPIRARIVTPEEMLRRMQERLARARLDTVRLSNLQQEKQRRVEELIDALDGDGATGSEPVAMAAALSGQRRVLGDAEAIARDLAAIADDILYARLDEKAGALLEAHHAAESRSSELRFRSEPWRQLAQADRRGTLGNGGFASNLVQLVGLALEISDDHARSATLALDEAERAVDAGQRTEALVVAVEHQASGLARIEDLLEELAEWDNFQNVLALTRDILNRQKALRERTQRFASGK